jgi:hypothetical protein
VNLTFFAPWLPWQRLPFWIFSTPKNCHTLYGWYSYKVSWSLMKGIPKFFKSPFFSSPDPKGHVRYCHHLASVVRPSSVVRRPSVNFSYFNLLLWNNWTKWNQTWQKASI